MDDPSHAYLSYLDTEMTETTQDTETARFIIDNDERCSWALRKIGALESDKAKRAAFVQREIERLQTWKAQEDAKAQRSIDHFTAMLRGYADILKAQGVLNDKRRWYKLPHGTLQLRTAPIEYERDDAKLLQWARPLGLVHITEKPAWSMIKEMVEAESDHAFAAVRDKITKQPIAGVTVKQPAREVFSIKIEA